MSADFVDQRKGDRRAHNDTERSLDFQRRLMAISTRIHATADLDQLMLDLGQDFCALFDSDRFTLYAATPEQAEVAAVARLDRHRALQHQRWNGGGFFTPLST